MDTYFKMLLETSFLCGGIILLIGFISPLIGKRHTAHWRYFLWIVLSIRLLLPFDMTVENPAVVIPMLPAVEGFQNRTAGLLKGEARLPEKEADLLETNPDLVEKGNITKDTLPAENSEIQETDREALDSLKENSTDKNGVKAVFSALWTGDFIIAVWTFTAFALLLWQTAVYFSFQKKVKRERHFLMKTEYIPVYYSSSVTTPMLLGLIHPQILLPEQEYTKEELLFILSHEMTHYRRKDLLVKLLLAAVKVLHWFNPFVYLMEKWACEDIELLCDMQVVRDFTREEKKSYSEMLLSCASRGEKERSGQRLICSSEFSEGTENLKKEVFQYF